MKLIDITVITSKSAKEFFFEYSGRKFELRCPNEADKLQWMNALGFLVDLEKNKSAALNKDKDVTAPAIPINPDDKSNLFFTLI